MSYDLVGWAVPNAIDLSVNPQTAMGQVVSTCPHMPEKPCLSRMQTQRAVGSRRPHRSRSLKSMALGHAHHSERNAETWWARPTLQVRVLNMLARLNHLAR